MPVSDIRLAAEWYSNLLGLPATQTSHNDMIYEVPMSGETRLALDGNKPVISNSSQALFFFWTQDIHAAEAFLKESAVTVLGQVEDIGSVSFLTFKDPDNNLLMVCQRNP